jgi:hypothetical protein
VRYLLSRRGHHPRPRRATSLVALSCGVLLALLSGCARMEIGSQFREDGSATHSIMVDFDRAALDDAALARVQQQLPVVERQARDNGYTTERIDTASDLGLRVTSTTDDATDPSAALNSLFNSLNDNLEAGPFAPFTGAYERQSGAVGGNAWALDLTVDADLLYRGLMDALGVNAGALTIDDLRQNLTLSYVATLPGEVKDTNGERVDDATVRWDLPPSGTATLSAESKLAKKGSTAWFILAAIGSFIGVVLVAALVGVILLRRRRAGHSRLPLTLPLSDSDPSPTVIRVEEPATMAEVGSTLVRVVERVVSGESAEQAADATADELRDKHDQQERN